MLMGKHFHRWQCHVVVSVVCELESSGDVAALLWAVEYFGYPPHTGCDYSTTSHTY